MSDQPPIDADPNGVPTEEELNRLQLTTLLYYLHESNPANGLIRDKTAPGAPSSIAAVGLALASLPVLVERGVVSREFAPEVVLRTLRFFRDSPQGPEPDATGYRGFYYHFLDMKSGRRVWECELSTIDSAFLFAGMLTCAAYFDADSEEEAEVRRLADELYRRADWQWALNGGAAVSHGWRPETGFIPHTWTGYDEALLIYLLGLGSPTFALPPESYAAYCSTAGGRRSRPRVLYSDRYSRLAPLDRPRPQGLHAGLRLSSPSDRYISGYARPTRSEFAVRRTLLGITGPRLSAAVNGIERQFYDYRARGPTVRRRTAPWVVVLRSLCSGIVSHRSRHGPARAGRDEDYGFKPSFNQTYAQPDGRRLVGHALPLRDRPGPGDPDDRELSNRPDLGDHAPLPVREGGTASGGLPRWLAVMRAASACSARGLKAVGS
jgi:hypothetical protein